MLTDLFVLGATGFVGSAVIDAALEAGMSIGAWARTPAQADALRQKGVRVTEPPHIPAARVVVDLVQPKLPQRLTEAAMIRTARERVAFTRSVLQALPKETLLLSVSGTDDFERIATHRSPFASKPRGFARIGSAVRHELTASNVAFASLHLGTVYGPGKAFASTLFPRLKAGKLPIVGNGQNRLPLIHVEDAARAIVHLARLDAGRLRAHPWIITDGTETTQRELLELGARLLGAPPPRTVPRWLASLVAGSVGANGLARDVPTDPAALLSTGFRLRYPTIATGLPATLGRLEAK